MNFTSFLAYTISISINFGWWIVPAIFTLASLYFMLRPSAHKKYWGLDTELGFLVELLWLIPILVSWLVYFIFN